MKFKHKIDKFVSTLSERISSGGVSQLEVKAEGERDIFGNMPALARKAAAEGIVLLKNNNALPYKLDTKISVLLGLPKSTEMSKQLPKKAIYAKFQMNTSAKEKVDAAAIIEKTIRYLSL